ncbi:hypothetical protein DTO282F9_699 [Paecilomyces variotii]|nr:hypothetical protein DTO282F9_699 [Paecilomyces variotii]
MLQLISKVLTCSPRPQRCDCSPQGPHERSTSSRTPGLFSAFISLVHRKFAVRPSEELNRFSKLQTTSNSVPEHPYDPSDELRRRAYAETTPKSFAFSLGTNGRVQRRLG